MTAIQFRPLTAKQQKQQMEALLQCSVEKRKFLVKKVWWLYPGDLPRQQCWLYNEICCGRSVNRVSAVAEYTR